MVQMDVKQVQFTGEQELAYGALASGGLQVTGYPGSPRIGTMITNIDHARQHPKSSARWAVYERVTLEKAIGATMAGCRRLELVRMLE